MRPLSKAPWVVVIHPPHERPRGCMYLHYPRAADVAEYLRAWLSVQIPEISPADVFVNGVPFALFPGPAGDRPPFVSRTRELERRDAHRRRIESARRHWAEKRNPSAG